MIAGTKLDPTWIYTGEELLAVMEPLSPPLLQIPCRNPASRAVQCQLNAGTSCPHSSSAPFPVSPSLHTTGIWFGRSFAVGAGLRTLVRTACALSPKISTRAVVLGPRTFHLPCEKAPLGKISGTTAMIFVLISSLKP